MNAPTDPQGLVNRSQPTNIRWSDCLWRAWNGGYCTIFFLFRLIIRGFFSSSLVWPSFPMLGQPHVPSIDLFPTHAFHESSITNRCMLTSSLWPLTNWPPLKPIPVARPDLMKEEADWFGLRLRTMSCFSPYHSHSTRFQARERTEIFKLIWLRAVTTTRFQFAEHLLRKGITNVDPQTPAFVRAARSGRVLPS